MSSLYDRTVRLIKTINALGPYSLPAKGYGINQIHTQHNVLFPSTPLTLLEVDTLLKQQTHRGVFLYERVVISSVVYHYYIINLGMARSNPKNQPYVDLAMSFDPTVASPGYLPCTYSASYQPHPYGQSAGSFTGAY